MNQRFIIFRGDPGGGPEPETDYEPAYGGLLGVLDEIQVLEGPTEARMPEPAVMRTREAPGEQTTVATATSVGERVQKTERLFDPRGSPPITWEGGEDDSALKDIRKQSAAQQVPAQLRRIRHIVKLRGLARIMRHPIVSHL
jgi:hypothetical protein